MKDMLLVHVCIYCTMMLLHNAAFLDNIYVKVMPVNTYFVLEQLNELLTFF